MKINKFLAVLKYHKGRSSLKKIFFRNYIGFIMNEIYRFYNEWGNLSNIYGSKQSAHISSKVIFFKYKSVQRESL